MHTCPEHWALIGQRSVRATSGRWAPPSFALRQATPIRLRPLLGIENWMYDPGRQTAYDRLRGRLDLLGRLVTLRCLLSARSGLSDSMSITVSPVTQVMPPNAPHARVGVKPVVGSSPKISSHLPKSGIVADMGGSKSLLLGQSEHRCDPVDRI